MREKAFWSDKERVGRLAVERAGASKSARVERRGNARRARAGRAARARAGEFGSTRPLSRTRDYKHTRRVELSLSRRDQAESVSYATTCRLNRRNVTERYTARTCTRRVTTRRTTVLVTRLLLLFTPSISIARISRARTFFLTSLPHPLLLPRRTWDTRRDR